MPLPFALLALLGAVMVMSTEGLEWTKPEEFFAAAVGCYVVANGGGLDDFILEAHHAERMSAQLRLSDQSPAFRAVPRTPRRVVSAAVCVTLTLL